MAGAEIGKVWVRVVPNATKFREDLRKALTRVERTTELEISASLDQRRFLSNVRDTMRQAQAFARIVANVDVETGNLRGTVRRAADEAETNVDVGLNLADAAFKERIRESVVKAVQGVDARIPATVDGERVRRQLAEKVEAAEAGLRANIPVDVDKGAAYRARLETLVAEIEALHPAVHANADTAEASGKLGVLARTRFAKVVADVDTSSLQKAQTLMMGLSGARVAGNMASEFMNLAKNLDVATPKIAAAAIRIGSVAAGALAATGNILTMGASLSKIAGVGLALPGIASAFAIGLAGSFDGLQNILVAAHQLGFALNADTFRATRLAFGRNFWSEAKAGLLDFIQAAILPLIEGYKELGFHLGEFWNQFFKGTARGINDAGGMAQLFVPLTQSIDIASKGIGVFMQALVRVAAAGGTFLPAMAQAFTDMSNKFASWASTVDIAGVIRGGFEVAKQLVSVFGSVFGILGGITRAAQAAGGASFGAFAEGLSQVNKAINGPLLQGALTTIFEGAYKAVQNISPGVAALGGAFVKLAPTISQAMQFAGESVGLLGKGLSKALETPQFSEGVSKMFKGIRDGVAELAPHLEDLGPKFGAIASAVGALAKGLGPVLGAGLDAFAPVLENISSVVQVLAPILANDLANALQIIGPVIQTVFDAISGFVEAHPDLVANLLILVGAIVALIGPISTVIGIIMTVVEVIGGVVAVFGALPVLIGVALVALVVLVIMYWDQIVGAIQAAWNWIVLAVQVGINFVWTIITTVLGTIVNWWIGMWSAIGNFLAGVWLNIKNWVGSGIQFVKDLIGSVVGWIVGFWNYSWATIGNYIRGVWEWVKEAVSNGIHFVSDVISRVLDFISSIWSRGWGAISDFISGIWDNLTRGAGIAMRYFTRAISDGFGTVMQFFRDLPTNIWNALVNAASWMETIGHNLMIGLWNGIAGIANWVYDQVRNVVDGIVNLAKNILGIHSPSRVFMEIGDYTGQGMVLGLAGQAANVQNAMSALVQPPSASQVVSPAVDVAGATDGVQYAAGPVSLDGATLRLETDAGTVMARLVQQGSRVLDRA